MSVNFFIFKFSSLSLFNCKYSLFESNWLIFCIIFFYYFNFGTYFFYLFYLLFVLIYYLFLCNYSFRMWFRFIWYSLFSFFIIFYDILKVSILSLGSCLEHNIFYNLFYNYNLYFYHIYNIYYFCPYHSSNLYYYIYLF